MNFSPYQPPPETQRTSSYSASDSLTGGGKGKSKRPWFSRDASTFQGSYQSGADPSSISNYNDAYAYDPSSLSPSSAPSAQNPTNSNSGGFGSNPPPLNPGNIWESSLGLRVDVMAGLAYLGGPGVALLLLIFETTNDYVRFHAYQSALLTTPIIVFWVLMTLLGVWRTLRRIYILLTLPLVLYTAYRAFRDPTNPTNGGMGSGGGLTGGYLERFYLPGIGDLAERWVGEE